MFPIFIFEQPLVILFITCYYVKFYEMNYSYFINLFMK